MYIRSISVSDLPQLLLCFDASVRLICCKDYTAEQIDAWISKASPERWQTLLESDLYFFAAEDTISKQIAGFTSINAKGYLHSMFVHPSWQRQGIASELLHTAENFARRHQVSSVFSEVSVTAKPFFETMGYLSEREQNVSIHETTMINFVMRKEII